MSVWDKLFLTSMIIMVLLLFCLIAAAMIHAPVYIVTALFIGVGITIAYNLTAVTVEIWRRK